MTRQDIVNEVNKYIPFFQEQWDRFCLMVEDYGKHLDRCGTDPLLEISQETVTKHNELFEACNKRRRELNEHDIKYSQKLDTARRLGKQKRAERSRKVIDRVVADVRALRYPGLEPPEPGCVRSCLALESYLSVPSDSWNHNFWVRPGPVNPLLWFDVIRKAGDQRTPNADERRMREAVILSVTHDECGQLDSSEEKVYRQQTYEGKYFARNDFCWDLWKTLEVNEPRIQRALDQVKPHLPGRSETRGLPRARAEGDPGGDTSTGKDNDVRKKVRMMRQMADRLAKYERLEPVLSHIHEIDRALADFEDVRHWVGEYHNAYTADKLQGMRAEVSRCAIDAEAARANSLQEEEYRLLVGAVSRLRTELQRMARLVESGGVHTSPKQATKTKTKADTARRRGKGILDTEVDDYLSNINWAPEHSSSRMAKAINAQDKSEYLPTSRQSIEGTSAYKKYKAKPNKKKKR